MKPELLPVHKTRCAPVLCARYAAEREWRKVADAFTYRQDEQLTLEWLGEESWRAGVLE